MGDEAKGARKSDDEDDLDPEYEPSEKELAEYAAWLGIDLERDPECVWIARKGLKTPLPASWKPCEAEDGEVFYFNSQTGESTWDHPCDDKLRRIYKKERAKKEGLPYDDDEEEAPQKKSEKKCKTSRKPPAPLPPSASLALAAQTSGGSGGGGNVLTGLLGPLPPLSLPRSNSGAFLPGVPPLDCNEVVVSSTKLVAPRESHHDEAAGTSPNELRNIPSKVEPALSPSCADSPEIAPLPNNVNESPLPKREDEFTSPPTPQLASILVAELRPEDQLSVWSPIEVAPIMDPNLSAMGSVAGGRPSFAISGSGSLELSSLSTVLEHFEDHDDSCEHDVPPTATPRLQELPPVQRDRQALVGSEASTPHPTPPATLDADAMATGFSSTVRLSDLKNMTGSTSQHLSAGLDQLSARVDMAQQAKKLQMELNRALGGVALANSKEKGFGVIATSKEQACLEAEGDAIISEHHLGVEGQVDAADQRCHGGEVHSDAPEALRKAALKIRCLENEVRRVEQLLEAARADSLREHEAHTQTRGAARQQHREVLALEAKLRGKDSEIERSLAEAQRCHAQLAERDVETHQLRLQLQARDAELAQLRSAIRVNSHQCDAVMQRQRFELGEREQALNERERFLDERERVSLEVESTLRKQRRELQAKLRHTELAALREVAAPFGLVPTAFDRRKMKHASGREGGDSPGGLGVDVEQKRGRSVVGNRAFDGAATKRSVSLDARIGAVQHGSNRTCQQNSDTEVTPGSVCLQVLPILNTDADGACVIDDVCEVNKKLSNTTANASPEVEMAQLGNKSVREIAEILRSRRRELRSEHNALEEDRQRWRCEARRYRGDNGRGVPSFPSMPKELIAERAALDNRAADLNRAIEAHKALEQLLVGKLEQRRGVGPSSPLDRRDLHACQLSSRATSAAPLGAAGGA